MSTTHIPPPILSEQSPSKKKVRNSNLELYRIIVMILIVAHHYVVNSGLIDIIRDSPISASSLTMILFGAWGKTGINCFVLITGYFMCKSSFSWGKLLKLYLQILFYTLAIYTIFCFTGHERLNLIQILWKIWPVKSIADGFTSCFILFYLFIPFLNLFLSNLDQKNHLRLLILLVLAFAVLPTVPKIQLTFNYTGWFMVLYLIGSYIRNYGIFKKISHWGWGWLTMATILLASTSVLLMSIIYKSGYITYFAPYYFIADSNKFLSLAVAVSSFMYFKDLRIPHSRLINAIGGATFGVLLIHANSDAMRQWLWRETVDCIGNFKDNLIWTLGYASASVLVIFIVCAGMDWFRGRIIEPKLIAGVKRLFSPIIIKLKEYAHFS